MLAFIIVLISVIFDRLTKYFASEYLQPAGTFPIIKDVLHLTYVENKGAAFGMLADNRWIFMTVSSVVILAIIVYMILQYEKLNLFTNITLSLILAGGIGNMIDRVAYGYVVDFVDFRLINFAVFNVADAFISVGAVLLFVYLIFFEKAAEEKKDV